MSDYVLKSIGVVRSELTQLENAPLQGDEGGLNAWLTIESAVEALEGIQVGDDILVLTWLHLADRNVLQVHPRSDLNRPLTGVFATRSPDRPNPIGLHRVTVLEIEPSRLLVASLEVVDGTPIIDIKPVLGDSDR